jgi:hypothetical protein
METSEEIIFDVCKNVQKEMERLEDENEMRFVFQFIELKIQRDRKKMYDQQFAQGLGAIPIRP